MWESYRTRGDVDGVFQQRLSSSTSPDTMHAAPMAEERLREETAVQRFHYCSCSSMRVHERGKKCEVSRGE